MNKEVIEIIDTLANKLGTTAEYLWEVLIKQAHVAVLSIVTGWIIVISILFIFKMHLNKMMKDLNQDDVDKTYAYNLLRNTYWVVLGLAVLIFLMTYSTLFDALFNPEYFALRKILSLIGK